MKNQDLVDAYVEEHENMWAYSTWKSTRSRLKTLGALLDEKPEAVYRALKQRDMAPYTIKTTLSILSSFYDWLVTNGHSLGNPYIGFKKKLTRTGNFRNAYKKRIVGTSFERARDLINSLDEDKDIKDHCMFLLKSGLRISESYRVEQVGTDQYVTGKGNKRRMIFEGAPTALVPESKLRRALKSLGLRPHDLRKLFATRLVNGGTPLQDVCEIMGWSNIGTAMCYLQPSRAKKLEAQIRRLI